MNSLSDFFSPLNLYLSVLSLYFWISLDSLGFIFGRFFLWTNKHFRVTYWMIGMGFYTFFWFLLHTFIPLSKQNVFFYSILLFTPSLFFYIKNKGWMTLLTSLRSNFLVLGIIIPLLPIIFVKSSLPPYLTDEMAYHYLAPSQIIKPSVWEFSSGIYHVIPKTLETFWNATFALTNTYSLARLSHVSIYITAIIAVSIWIRSTFGLLASVLFPLLILYLPQDLLIQATSGYVDVATASFVLLAIVSSLDFALHHDKSAVFFSISFWALALGTKYSALNSFASWVAMFFVFSVFFVDKKNLLSIFTAKKIIALITLFIVLGGYWYLKNLVLLGNPIYPFFFGCQPKDCMGGSSYFEGWTKQISLENFPAIANDIMAGNKKILVAFLSSFVMLIINRSQKLLKANILLAAGIAIEFILIRFSAGYLFRYFIHMQFLAILFVSIQLGVAISSHPLSKLFKYAYMFLLVCISLKIFYQGTNLYYSKHFLPQREIDYAVGNTDIYSWTYDLFPRMYQVIYWCNTPNPDGSFKTFSAQDPDLVWFEYDGQMRAYVLYCDYGPFYGTGMPLDKIVPTLQQNGDKFYFTSINRCIKSGPLKRLGYETEHQMQMREINNELVCNSNEVLPNLYHFE